MIDKIKARLIRALGGFTGEDVTAAYVDGMGYAFGVWAKHANKVRR